MGETAALTPRGIGFDMLHNDARDAERILGRREGGSSFTLRTGECRMVNAECGKEVGSAKSEDRNKRRNVGSTATERFALRRTGSATKGLRSPDTPRQGTAPG